MVVIMFKPFRIQKQESSFLMYTCFAMRLTEDIEIFWISKDESGEIQNIDGKTLSTKYKFKNFVK